MRTLLIVCFVITVYAQTSPPSQVKRLDQQNETKLEQNKSKGVQSTATAAPRSLRDVDWSNWALVLVGFAGTIIAVRTLCAINTQARIASVGLKAARIAANASAVSAKAAKESADIAARALLLTERADILIDGVSISTHPALQPNSVVTISFRNFGRTRANRIETKAALLVPDVDLGQPGALKRIPTPTAIGAGDGFNCVFPPMHEFLTRETFTEILSGVVPLKFAAEVRYLDVFGNLHHCRYSGTFLSASCDFGIDDDVEAD